MPPKKSKKPRTAQEVKKAGWAAAGKKDEDPGIFAWYKHPRWNGAKHVPAAWCVMGFVLSWAAINFLVNAHRILMISIRPHQDVTAFDMARLANDTCSIILSLLVFALWLTICFKFVFIRHIWSWKTWIFTDTMMPGGFVPRPAAVSVGLLMFLTQVFIAERVVPGDKLFHRDHQDFYTNLVSHGEWCRADVREEATYMDDWFSRLLRSNPSGCYFGECEANSTDQGCLPGGTGPSIPKMFNTALSHSANVTLEPSVPMANVVNPYNQSSHIVVNLFQAAQSTFPSLFGHRQPLEVSHLHIDMKNKCLYQCVKWRVWGFNGLVSKGGVITAGAAFVTKLTESISGWAGLERVSVDTSEAALTKILDKTRPPSKQDAKDRGLWYDTFHKSALVPALIFVGLRLFFAFWVFKIDDYGFFTVDFYVSQVLLFAIAVAFFLRSCNPFRWERVAYTDNLWTKGVEKFMIVGTNEGGDKALKTKEVDLYVWLHMSHAERAYLLINYARQVSAKASLATQAGHNHVESLATQWYEASAPVMAEPGEQLPWGKSKVMEIKSLKVARHVLPGGTRVVHKLPGGTVTKLDAGLAYVKWDHVHIHHVDGKSDPNLLASHEDQIYDNGQDWLKKLEEGNKVDFERATTSAVDPLHLVEVTDGFTKLMNEHVPEKIRDATIEKILKRIQADVDMKSKKGFWQWIRCCKATTQAEQKDKKADAAKPLLPKG